MRRGPRSTAAGRTIPGPLPILVPTLPPSLAPISNRHTRNAARHPDRRLSPAIISNRHLVQLEITTTHPESITSLFLIVTKQPDYPRAHFNSPEKLVAQACLPACPDTGPGVRFPSESEHSTAISNRHLVQLEITATPPKSTTSLFLIDPKHPLFPTCFYPPSKFPHPYSATPRDSVDTRAPKCQKWSRSFTLSFMRRGSLAATGAS
jgi:hypothetical protein